MTGWSFECHRTGVDDAYVGIDSFGQKCVQGNRSKHDGCTSLQAGEISRTCGALISLYFTFEGSNTTIGTLFPLLPQSIQDLNQGIIALVINLVVMTVVSLITKDNVSIDDRQSRVA